jgi:uncharacterized protein (DUF58 family)
MSRRPTGRGIIVSVVGAVLLLVAAATAQTGWLFVVAVAVLGTVLGCVFVPHRLTSLWVERLVPPIAVAGDLIDLSLVVTNRGKRPTPAIRVEDLPSAFPAIFDGLLPGSSATARSQRIVPRRGVFPGGRVKMTCGAPFGFIASSRTVTVDSPITVVPRTIELTSLPWISGGVDAHDGGGAVRSASGDYTGVRDFRPGDARRAVHWRSSARAGTLIVREFEDVSAPRPTLVVHGADVGTPPDSPFEAVVTAAASIARHIVTSGRDVHLAATTIPDGIRHLVDASVPEILEWLAQCTPSHGSLTDAVAAALSRAQAGAQVIMVTTTSGAPSADVAGALDHVSRTGRNPALVLARSASWLPTDEGVDDAVIAATRSRLEPRVIARGEDLARCLA